MSTPAFDLTEYTGPITAGYLYLSSLFGLAVTVPNVPTRVRCCAATSADARTQRPPPSPG